MKKTSKICEFYANFDKISSKIFLKCFFLYEALVFEKSDLLQSCSSEFLVYFKKKIYLIWTQNKGARVKILKKDQKNVF